MPGRGRAAIVAGTIPARGCRDQVQPSARPVACAAATASAGAVHGINPGRHQPQRRCLHRLLRLRQRRVAASRTRSPTTWIAGAGAGSPARSTRNTCATSSPRCRRARDWPQGQRRAARRRLLRRLHGRAPRQRARQQAGRSRCSPRSTRSRTRAGVQRMIGQLHDVGVAVPFVVYAGAGPARPDAGRSRTSTPAAWACPTATTTSRPSRASSRRARSTSSTWPRCSSSPAPTPDAGQGSTPTPCSRSRSAWPRPRSTTSRCAIPKQQDHKTAFADLPKLAPRFDWARYFDAARHAARRPQRDRSRSSCSRSTRSSRRRRSPQWQTYLQWHVLNTAADSLSDAVRRGELRLLRQVPQRRHGDEAALEALRRGHRRPARRGARPEATSRSTSRRRPRRACRRW